jgi:hypothetical protein
MIKKLEELNKRRKEVLKFFELKKIDFKSKSRIIPIEAIKYNKTKWINYRDIRINNFYLMRKFLNNNPRLFRGKEINIYLFDFINSYSSEILEICREYVYFIEDNKLIKYQIAKRIGNTNSFNTFFRNIFITGFKKKSYGILKSRIQFLYKIDDAIREQIKNKGFRK